MDDFNKGSKITSRFADAMERTNAPFIRVMLGNPMTNAREYADP